MSKAIHYINTLIIGQGLAGSMLAWHLMRRNQSVNIVNDESAACASRVAAGLFNPVTGQRLVLQEQAAHIIPAAQQCYQELEACLGKTFFHDKPMLRILKNEKELQTFEKRSHEKKYTPYLGKHIDHIEAIHAPHGLCEQLQTGYLDTNRLLDSLRDYFITQACYTADHFEYRDLTVSEKGIVWKQTHAERIIFCQGFMDQDNPWFNDLPFQPAKGEILTLRSNSKLPEQIINGGKWLLPLDNGHYKAGATYSHDLCDIEPSAEARIEILNGLQKMLHNAPHIDLLKQQAGVRPNTLDKQPFIGFHPDIPQIGIFNGFGSKGSMLIPYYAQAFTEHLVCGKPIPCEADIIRINKGGNTTDTRSSIRLSLTDRVHQHLLTHIQNSCRQTNNVTQSSYIAIDATAGNGHDTLFLARHIGSQGQIFAFDLQKKAIDNTHQRLKEANLNDHTRLFCAGHEQMQKYIPAPLVGKVNLIMFNLGYLPHADKSIITNKNTTIQALDAAIQLIAPGGCISILAYPGHAGGATETEAIILWLEKLPSLFTTIKHKSLHSNPHSPLWFEIIRQDDQTKAQT